MFARLFNPETPFWRAMGTIADIIWVNVLFILTSVPIVTLGASLTALYGTCMRLQAGSDQGVNRTFFRLFKTNFWPATALWGVYGPVGLALAASWIYLPEVGYLPLKAAFTACYLFVFPFPWVLQATFANTFSATLKNSFVIPLARLPYALGVGAVTALIVGVFAATTAYLPALLPPLLLAGFGLLVSAQVPLILRTLSPWLEAE